MLRVLSNFPGASGIGAAIFVLLLIWLLAYVRTGQDVYFHFDPQGERGSFEKLLAVYVRIAEVVISLAAGSIVLLVGSSAFRTGGRLPWFFASPLLLLGFS